MLFFELAATSLGIGYIGKGAGTVAAVACCICWYLAWAGGYPPAILSVIITVVITLLGIWAGNKVEPLWGKDHQRVVIDEVAGIVYRPAFYTCQFKICVNRTYFIPVFRHHKTSVHQKNGGFARRLGCNDGRCIGRGLC